ncbi:MAG: hypothetical protein JSR41_02370, partial [Proteobacteria bacterium]|nr:hypothetical protein [Pseudomonadota bacterium]
VLAKYPQFSDEKIGYYVWPGEGTGDPLPQLPPPPWTPAATFTTLPNLSISSFKPAAIQIRDYEGAPSMVNGPTLISAMIAGDLRTLNGKTPFVYAVDPNNLFSLYTPWTALFHTSGQGGVSFGLQLGNALAGTYKGGVNIYICSTQDCSVRLGNVPASFPYDIVLKRNTRFEASNATTIAASVPFGAQTQKLAFRIDPPEGTPIGGLELHPAYSPLNVKSTLRDDGDGKGTLLLEIPPATPIGRYSLQYGFSTKSTVAYVPMRMLTVTLDVVPNEQEPYVFSPPSMTMSSSLANGVYYQTDGVNVTQAQGTLALALPRAEEILYTPAQEAAIPPENRGRFIEASKRDYQVNPSTVTVLLNHTACIRSTQTTPTGALKTICVPSGEYAFRIKFNYTNNGTTVPLYYHGTMTVTP